MRPKNTLIFFLFFLRFAASAQDTAINSKLIDQLKHELATEKNDSIRTKILDRLGFNYQVLNADSAIKYTEAGINLARQSGYVRDEATLLATLSGIRSQQGKFAEALDLLFNSLKIAEDNNFPYETARANRRIGGVYFDLENFPKGITYSLEALKMDEESKNKSATIDRIFLAKAYEQMNQLDSASLYVDIALKEKESFSNIIQEAYRISGIIKMKEGSYLLADSLLNKGLAISMKNSDFLTASDLCAAISNLFSKLNKKDSALFYALKGFEYGEKVSYKKGIMISGNQLAELYESTQPAVALKYFKIVASEKDSLFGVSNIQTIQNLITREEEKQKELEAARISYQSRLKLYGALICLFVLFIIAFILFRNNRQKQKANVLLQTQKEKIEVTLTELKNTQKQLIQSEKMASLGELTAGIAHEIQNPLNFVNNFSEVNKEMIDEATEEINKGNIEEVKNILNDIKDNEEKINHHGKRADSIVKGMLQHSRSSTGVKEPTDINALCDEYLRLSYHGLRAKDKSFNADFKTDFDNSIGKINIIPQDIGRVLLNLVNNAFYAVNEKQKITKENLPAAQAGYQPTVFLSSKKTAEKVLLTVKDNGNGIPQKIVDKIFQPFFTTKPTGQGTGLGLSLSYDIVKAHGGEIKVQSKEGEGTEFIIYLPVA